MGNDKRQTTQTTGSMPRASSQVGTHGQGQNQDRGEWNDRAQREMQQGDQTRPAEPTGTNPLDKDQQAVNKNRPVGQNR
jgi:hypothetical protein